MTPLITFTTPPHSCPYRPGETARLKYELVGEITPEEYEERMLAGWRRFGHSLFKPVCPQCQACRPIRVPVATFRPNRSQRRALKANADIRITIAKPEVTNEKLDLYDRFHSAQSERVGWPIRLAKEVSEYEESFVRQPFTVEEWQFFQGNQLVGVGYVDTLPQNLSAIYFFHEPNMRHRSLGTFNVLQILDAARQRGKYSVHLGYFVEGCRSLEYKANFAPNELRMPNGSWIPFRS